MDDYEFIKELGRGAQGCVFLATNKQTGEIVAIKKMLRKCYSWEECVNMPEVVSLRRIDSHPHIVKLKDAIQDDDGYLYLVFESMNCDLVEFLNKRMEKEGVLPKETEVRDWCLQILQAIAYIHQSGYFHRDIKPDNLLVSLTEGSNTVLKIADFGVARALSCRMPMTHTVGTVLYRAPEVLLELESYDAAVDMWALGVVMIEIMTCRTLFNGLNAMEVLYEICILIGSPNEKTWPEGMRHARSINFIFPQLGRADLSTLLGPTASEDAVDLVTKLLSWDPRKRPTAVQALEHRFFRTSSTSRPIFGKPSSVGLRCEADRNNCPTESDNLIRC